MAVDPERLREELRQMRVLIQKDPEVRARFDADGNGVIDGEEWEQVRQLVIQRLEREQAEAAEAERLAQESGESLAAPVSIGDIAQGIYDGDLREPDAPPPTAIAEADELVLDQGGGIGRMLEGMVRRRYVVHAADGSRLGAIEQRENEMLQQLGSRSLLKVPDLHFRVTDGTGEIATFRRTRNLSLDRMEVFDAAGRLVAGVEWKPSLLGMKFEVMPSGEGGVLRIQRSLRSPFTLGITDCVDDSVGAIERGWSGLGAFLTGGDRLRVRLVPGEITPEQRWGVLAAALLADLTAEGSD